MRHARARRGAVAGLLALAALLAPAAARGQAHVTGEWRLLGHTTPLNPIHVALLRTGKILIAAGSENDPTHTTFRAAVYDPQRGTFSVQTVPWDLFCNGMAALPDGRILIAGGNLRYNPFRGLKTTTIFDPAVERFIEVQEMARGRWYPSTTALADGRTMTFSGWLDTAGVPNEAVELYHVPTGWSPEFRAPFTPPLYPWLHLLPDGRVFLSGSHPESRLFDPVARTWSGVVARTRYGGDRRYGSSVLLPLRPEEGYRARVMIMGGDNPATDTAEIIDLSAPSPAWRALPPMSAPRVEMNAVLLPTGAVLALGGSAIDNDASTASLAADLFDPRTETWAPAGRMFLPRLYHSVALLLPDATVWVAGSNPFQGEWENRMEVYLPPYLFTTDASGRVVPAPRPSISGAPGRIGYDAPFTVSTPNAADIADVVLVRPGSATHAFDFEQRVVGLRFTAGSGSLTVMAPPTATIAPPGYYMLFLIDRRGVPSVARFVQLAQNPTNQPPRGAITSPSADVTIRAGQSVTFAGEGTDPDGSVARYSWVFPGGTPRTSTAAVPGAVTFSTAGTYVVSLTVTDDLGDNDPSPPFRIVTVEPGSFTAAIPSPANGATVRGTQTVTMTVSGGTAPFSYTLRVGSTQVFTQTTSATSTSFAWNTATLSDGSHTLTLAARDSAGQTATAAVTVTVANGSPGGLTLAITAPKPGATVSGTTWVVLWLESPEATAPYTYTLSAAGQTVWTQASSSRGPVSLPWETQKTPNGPQTLTATVRDSAGRTGTATVAVTVQNGTSPPPGALTAAFTAPPEGATVSGTVTVGMSAGGGSPAYTYTFRVDGTQVFTQTTTATTTSFAWNTAGTSNGTHTLGLTVTDSAGASATASRTVTVSNGSTGALRLAMTSPKPGATVSGTTWAVLWLESPEATAPYTYTLSVAGQTVWTQASSSRGPVSLPWETQKTPSGPQTLTATVRDASGRTGSVAVTVTVQNP